MKAGVTKESTELICSECGCKNFHYEKTGCGETGHMVCDDCDLMTALAFNEEEARCFVRRKILLED